MGHLEGRPDAYFSTPCMGVNVGTLGVKTAERWARVAEAQRRRWAALLAKIEAAIERINAALDEPE